MSSMRMHKLHFALYLFLISLSIGSHSAYSIVALEVPLQRQENALPAEASETSQPPSAINSATPEKAPTAKTSESVSHTPKTKTKPKKFTKGDAKDLLYQWLGVSFLFIFFLVSIMVLLRNRNH